MVTYLNVVCEGYVLEVSEANHEFTPRGEVQPLRDVYFALLPQGVKGVNFRLSFRNHLNWTDDNSVKIQLENGKFKEIRGCKLNRNKWIIRPINIHFGRFYGDSKEYGLNFVIDIFNQH